MVKRKILSVILALTMVVGVLPLVNLEVQAEEVNYIMVLGMSAIDNWNKEGSLSVDETDKIVMGTYGGSSVEWVKLNDEGLMFSTRSLGESVFGNLAGPYPDSTLHTVMEALYNTNSLELTDKEMEVIVSIELEESSMYDDAGDLANQYFFPLSLEEFITNIGESTDLATDNSVYFWWLRSSDGGGNARAVCDYGNIDYDNVSTNIGGVRPAFNLNLDSVLFTSASGAIKSDFGVIGSDNTSTNIWKLTLKDGDEDFAVELPTTGYIGQNITVNVTNVGTGTYTQTSAILSDSTDTVVAYGKIGTNGTGDKTFTIPSTVVAGDYTLHVFEEQVNGSNETDYASNVVTTSITISSATSPSPTPIWVPTADDAYRLSFVSGMPVEFTTSQVPYEFTLVNDLQGPLCFDVFQAYRGDYNIGVTYTSYANGMKVYNLSEPITVTLQIPSSLQKENRSYEMICVHQDGNVVVLTDLDTNPNTITFTTDKGYAFALCYKD